MFEHVFSEITAEVTVLLEQQIFKCDFNQVSICTVISWAPPQAHTLSPLKKSRPQLGGVQLDKDLRVLTGYLSSHTSWPVRDKFARLMQISTLLTLETVSSAL